MKKILVQNYVQRETVECPDPEKCFVYLFTSGGCLISRGPASLDFQGEFLVMQNVVANGNLKLPEIIVSYDHIASVSVYQSS